MARWEIGPVAETEMEISMLSIAQSCKKPRHVRLYNIIPIEIRLTNSIWQMKQTLKSGKSKWIKQIKSANNYYYY